MQSNLPFNGIRAIEFAVNAAGPLVGKLLADFGAEVVTVENRTHIAIHGGGRQPSITSEGSTSMNVGFFFNKYSFQELLKKVIISTCTASNNKCQVSFKKLVIKKFCVIK